MESNISNESDKEKKQHEHEHHHSHGGCCGMPMGGRTDPPWSKWVLYGFFAIIAFYLFTEHRAHVFGFLPYLFLLACPLMHLFHGHHHRHHGQTIDEKNDSERKGE